MSTSGLVLMALSPLVQRQLSLAFEQRAVHKRYVAVVHGILTAHGSDEWQTIDAPIAADWPRRPLRIIDAAGKPSQTRWRVLAYDEAMDCTRLELEPVTGRTHQLRVHLAAIGHPIVGDGKYGGPEAFLTGSISRKMHLHARRLIIDHPDGAPHENTARALKFARQLRGRFGLQVFEVDERYSTTEAIAAGAADADAASACIILEQFLRNLP